MKDADHILENLKGRGHRMTKVRKAVLEILCKSKVPLPAQELITGLKRKSLPVNKTTVYREIDFLLAEKVLREVDLLDGKKRYEVLLENDHHHHMICTQCQSIQCIEMAHDLDELEHNLLCKFNFKVTSHSLEFFGLCDKCR